MNWSKPRIGLSTETNYLTGFENPLSISVRGSVIHRWSCCLGKNPLSLLKVMKESSKNENGCDEILIKLLTKYLGTNWQIGRQMYYPGVLPYSRTFVKLLAWKKIINCFSQSVIICIKELALLIYLHVLTLSCQIWTIKWSCLPRNVWKVMSDLRKKKTGLS